MKKLILTLLLTHLLVNAYSQYQWAKHIGANSFYGNESSNAITDDTNTYLIGQYGNALYLPNDTLYSSGLNDIFIVKFDQNGNEIWSKTLGGNFSQPSAFEGAGGVFDPVNNCIYIAGSYINSITLGSTTLISNNTNTDDIFVARMDLNGNFIWAKKGGGAWADYVINIRVNPYGKVYLVSQTTDSAYFGTYHLGPGGGIVQYDATGNLLSAEIKFTSPYNSASDVFLNFINTDLIMYGLFKINPFHIDTATLVSKGDYDGFVARADSMGHIKWIKTFGGTGLDGVQSLSIDNNNNLFITGAFNDSINLGGLHLVNTGNDILIAKYNQNGTAIWARNIHASGANEYPGTIVSDANGNCYITGGFSGNASFGSNAVSTTYANDMFLTRYDSSGNCLGVVHFGEGYGSSLAVDNSGSVYVNGDFDNSVTIGSNNFTSYGGYDIFLTKLDIKLNVKDKRMSTNNTLTIYANPNKGTCNITVPDDLLHEDNLVLKIFDTNGKLIQQLPVTIDQEKIKINIQEEATGVYNVTLGNSKKMYSGKIVFE